MHLGLAASEPLLMYLGAIIVFLLSVFWKPEIGLYYLVPLLPIQTARYWIHVYPFGEKLVDVLLLGVLLGLFFHAKRPFFLSSSMNKVIVVSSVLLYISLWQGAFFLGQALPLSVADPRFSDWKNYVEMMLLFPIVAAAIRTPKQMIILLVLMCLSVLMVNRNYHSMIASRDYSAFSYELRDAGPLGYAGENGMGAFQAEFAVFLIGFAAFIKKPILKLTLWAITFTSVYSLVFTFSRGGYLGFLVGLLVVGLIKERKLLILLAVILVTWQSLTPRAVTERVLMTYSEGQGLDPSAGDRVSIWQDAMQVINHDPVFGTGFDTYSYMGRVGSYKDTHNYYVKVLLETGAVGLLIFLGLLAVACRMAWRLYRCAKDPFLSAIACGFFAMFVTTVIVNLFGDRWTFLQVNGFFWVLLGLVERGLQTTKNEPDVSSSRMGELVADSRGETVVAHA
jgi:putative inorganic carbon (hco3(-)) transporter